MWNKKTGGNPFFVNEFLKSLHAASLLTYDRQAGIWSWDLTEIQARGITDNVADLLAGNIRQLPGQTRKALEIAACIGNKFSLHTVAEVVHNAAGAVSPFLRQAVEEGLIRPIGDAYKTLDLKLPEIKENIYIEYVFAHDQIRHAAYSLIPADARPAIHIRIGRVLLRNYHEESFGNSIFDVVNQFKAGIASIESQAERRELSKLFLAAGQRAKSSAAHEPALSYLKTGIELLGENCWNEEYDLTLSLHLEAAEAAYASTDFEEIEHLAATVLQHARTLLDHVKVQEVRIQGYIAEKQLLEAVNTALKVLKLLGEEFPKKPGKVRILYHLLKTRLALAGKGIEDLFRLPAMADPKKLAVMRILASVASAAYMRSPLCFLSSLLGV